jgi:spermidine/putrescine transport system permease protein
MAVYALLIYVFLYAPIALIVFFSFNAGRYAMDWQGFSIQWYGKAFTNPLIVEALFTSLTIAGSTAVLSVIFGTLAALGLERTRGLLKHAFDGLIYIAIMVPGIVIGISTLIAFVTLFDAVNPTVERLLSWKFQMGIWTVIAAHVLFNIAVVCLLVRARLTGFKVLARVLTIRDQPAVVQLPLVQEIRLRPCTVCGIGAPAASRMVGQMSIFNAISFTLRPPRISLG